MAIRSTIFAGNSMKVLKNLFSAGVLGVAIAVSAPASALTWKIDQVLTGAGVAGFGASGFHKGDGTNVMSGASLGSITGSGMLGTYNDVTGAFSAIFDFAGVGGPSFSLSGMNLLFGGAENKLLSNSVLTATFDGMTGPNGATKVTDIGFKLGDICCNNNGNGPNSFVTDGMGGGIITLWGADGFSLGNGTYAGSTVGLDLRVRLSAVPLPLTLPLLGTALFALGLARRRRKLALEA